MDEEDPFPKEKAPPFYRKEIDPNYEVTYFIFSYSPIPKEGAWPYVTQFLGERKRQPDGKKNYMNLPPRVWLVVQPDGKVKPHHLVPQRQQAQIRKPRNR
jgi:hypothetical protein